MLSGIFIQHENKGTINHNMYITEGATCPRYKIYMYSDSLWFETKKKRGGEGEDNSVLMS